MAVGVEEKVTLSLVDGKLPCPVAFEIAGELKVSRRKIGESADRLGIMLSLCQLGCFESKKATANDGGSLDVNSALAEEIKASLVNGRLLCPLAFKIARKLKVAPREVGQAADKLKVRIGGCQLGCFP